MWFRRIILIMKLIANRLFPKLYRLLFRFKRNPSDISVLLKFLFDSNGSIGFLNRLKIVVGICKVSSVVPCPHTEKEIIEIIVGIFASPNERDSCIVEAGCFKGGSTAKLSLAAKILNKKLIVFDSFEGIPENDEMNSDGTYHHQPGFWCGSLDEVRHNVTRYGSIESCEFIKGLFETTMPQFKTPISTAFVDVDLASSVKTCLRYLYPLIVNNGIFFNQDGHLKQVVEVFKDEEFWQKEVGFTKPVIVGLGTSKLVSISKIQSPA